FAFQNFCEFGTAERRAAFAEFRRGRGDILRSYAAFEILRRQYNKPWWEWPAEWRAPNAHLLQNLQATREPELVYFEFIQWIAHEQLAACRKRADHAALPIGLFLDLAI